MNKNQFKACRLQLGMSTDAMGVALGIRKGTVQKLENGVEPMNNIPFNKRTSLNHITSFACAWMLFNGGPLIPWPAGEDYQRFRDFRDFHSMTNNEMAALFDVSIRDMEYMVSPMTEWRTAKMKLMALCWMRLFGSRDPFAFPLHEHYDAASVNTCPMRLDPAITIEGRPVI